MHTYAPPHTQLRVQEPWTDCAVPVVVFPLRGSDVWVTPAKGRYLNNWKSIVPSDIFANVKKSKVARAKEMS